MGSKQVDAGPSQKGAGLDGFFYLAIAAFGAVIIYQALHHAVSAAQRLYHLHHGQILPCLVAGGIFFCLTGVAVLWNFLYRRAEEGWITAEDSESVLLGTDDKTGKEVHLKAPFRTMHTQLIGTTNAGKTASVILPWVARDIELGRGCLIVDGKSDRSFLDQLFARVVQAGREKDFLVFSLAIPEISSTFNPFCHGSPEQITERVFSAFEFTDEYYRGIQFSALRTVIALLMRKGQTPMPGVIRELLRDKEKLQGWATDLNDENLSRDVLALIQDDDEEFTKKYSGLVMSLGHFSQGDTLLLYNSRSPEIRLTEALKERKICYFQLPTMQFPFLGAATGKLLLQNLQSAISELQVSGERLKSLFSVYLDDFNDYIYPGFVSTLNKSRSANIGVVFSHQSLGDLEKVGSDFAQSVMTNTNIKIVMRSNDPESAEHFAKTIGTIRTEKTTERRKKAFVGEENTGDKSVRDVEEYLFHPNVFKAELGQGEGVVVIPHPRGRVVKRVRIKTVPDLPALQLPVRGLPWVNLQVESTYQGTPSLKTKKPSRTGKKRKPGSKEVLETA